MLLNCLERFPNRRLNDSLDEMSRRKWRVELERRKPSGGKLDVGPGPDVQFSSGKPKVRALTETVYRSLRANFANCGSRLRAHQGSGSGLPGPNASAEAPCSSLSPPSGAEPRTFVPYSVREHFRNGRGIYWPSSRRRKVMFRKVSSLLACRALQACLMFVLLCPAVARAQFDTATVLGSVKDSSGAVVPGATVTLKNVGDRHYRHRRHRRRRQLPVPERPRRHLHRARRAAGLLGRRGGERRGDGQRPAARRPAR